LRGVSHEWAFFISLVFGAALIFFAKTPKATLAVTIYAVSLSALLGTSALYHRVNWKRPQVRTWMRRLDHSMIFFLIAGTYTPFALIVMHGALATAILVVVWAGAIGGAIVEMVWIGHPKWVSATVYLAIAGVLLSYIMYIVRPSLAVSVGKVFAPITKLLENKYYFDWFNENVLAAGARLLGRGLRALRTAGIVLDQKLDIGILEFRQRHFGGVLHRLRGNPGVTRSRQRQEQPDLDLTAADRQRLLGRAGRSWRRAGLLRTEWIGELAKALLNPGAGTKQRRA